MNILSDLMRVCYVCSLCVCVCVLRARTTVRVRSLLSNNSLLAILCLVCRILVAEHNWEFMLVSDDACVCVCAGYNLQAQ